MIEVGRLKKIATGLLKCLRFSKWGADLRSRLLLFRIGILTSLYPERHDWLLKRLKSAIAKEAPDGILGIAMRTYSGRRRTTFYVRLRAGNEADYQSLWECLNEGFYPAPPVKIHHVLDGGANLGFFSVTLVGSPSIRDIILVEPEPGNLELLRQNADIHSSYKILPVALSSHNGTAQFDLAASNSGHLKGSPGYLFESATRSITVECKRIQDVLPPHWDMKHTWVKLDIEGAEYSVLPDLLRTNRRPVAISAELHDYDNADGGNLVRNLESAGYRVELVNPGDARNTCRQLTAWYAEGASTST
jgi:FkbM family methyltransferase